MDTPHDRNAQLEGLVAKYGNLIASIVRKVAGDQAGRVGDDVEQRVAVALWRRLESEQTIEHPASYLYRMAVRETIRALRQEVVHQTVSLDDGQIDPLDSRDPQQTFEAGETRTAIRRGLQALRPDRRLAVNQHLAGRSVSEIMAMYGWPYHRARNLIARGLADLRQSLREYRYRT